VSEALIPTQHHIRTNDGVCVSIGADELHRINVLLYEKKLTLIAQIHSHPGRAYHSSTDDEFAIATAAGCLSLVVPNFGSGAFDLKNIASYRLGSNGKWHKISFAEINRLIRITD
jgi:proteasome lid subunit RPN8/RPN11